VKVAASFELMDFTRGFKGIGGSAPIAADGCLKHFLQLEKWDAER
jgi:hypothetical protein